MELSIIKIESEWRKMKKIKSGSSKMKRKIMGFILAFTLMVCLLPWNVLADGGGVMIFYIDAETKESIPGVFPEYLITDIDPVLGFRVHTNKAKFVFEAPDGSALTVESYQYNEYELDDGKYNSYFSCAGISMTQPGKHTLKSYPIPSGYEVVELYGISDWSDEKTENGVIPKLPYTEADYYLFDGAIYIAVRKADSGQGSTPAAEKPSPWAEEQVNAAISAKLVPQSLQSKYTQAATRAEFCALAVALYETAAGEEITDRKTFDDTKDVNVEKAAAIGVVSGVGDNKFSPDTQLTREQAAVMLSRLADAIGKPLQKQAATFTDNGNIASWAIEGVGQVQAAGIMSGVGENTFAPQDPYTREQSILTIMRLYGAVK